MVEIDARSGAVRVEHRLQGHDVEPALWLIAPKAQPSLDDAEALAALIAYLDRRFVLSDATGRRLPLKPAGSDLAGDDVRFRFTGQMAVENPSLTVDSAIFRDVYPDQENQVNVRRSKVTLTLLFTPAMADAQTVRLP